MKDPRDCKRNLVRCGSLLFGTARLWSLRRALQGWHTLRSGLLDAMLLLPLDPYLRVLGADVTSIWSRRESEESESLVSEV